MNKLDLTKYKSVIFDLDGVIYRGEQVLAGAVELVAALQDSGKSVLFLTNNSSKTADQILSKLIKLGVEGIDKSNILSSSIATGYWLKANAEPKSRVLVFGGDGISQAVSSNGFTITQELDADYVVTGINFNLSYQNLTVASLAIRAGAKLVATNRDLTYPTERGLQPGAGSLLAAIVAASGAEPIAVLGKPSPDIFQLALDQLGVHPKECLMVGDRIDTDITGAKSLDIDTALVLTGVSTLQDLADSNLKPTYVLESLVDIES